MRSPTARPVSWWAVLPSVCAPLVLVAGWTLAAASQPPTYDPTTETLSALAAEGATDRWVMTFAFVGVGLCYALTAFALCPPALPGRVVLGAGGAATVLVAAFPEPDGGASNHHGVAATIASSAVAVWPALAARRDPRVSWVLRPVVSYTVALLLTGLLGWFVIELRGGTMAGLAERLAALAEALWLMVVAVTLRRSAIATRS